MWMSEALCFRHKEHRTPRPECYGAVTPPWSLPPANHENAFPPARKHYPRTDTLAAIAAKLGVPGTTDTKEK